MEGKSWEDLELYLPAIPHRPGDITLRKITNGGFELT